MHSPTSSLDFHTPFSKLELVGTQLYTWKSICKLFHATVKVLGNKTSIPKAGKSYKPFWFLRIPRL